MKRCLLRQRLVRLNKVRQSLGFVLLLVSLVSWSAVGRAEAQALPALLENPYAHEAAFRPLDNDWSIQGVFEVPAYSFYLGAPAVHGVSYQPNFSSRLGVRALWREWGTLIALPLPLPKEEKERRGDSRQTSFVVQNYWHQHALDVYYQKFVGFYVSSPTTELSLHKPGRYPQLPDARVVNFGFNFYHAMDPGSYSLKAAYNQTEFQLKSGGSWIYGAFFNHLEMDLGSVLVPGSDPTSLSQMPNLNSGRFDTIGFGGGYGYTYVNFPWFASGQLVFAPALQWQHIQRLDGNGSTLISWAAKGNLNLSAGYNHREYVGGAKVLVDSLYSIINDTQVWSSLISGQLFFGRRF